jgi:hypothetical protein
MHRENIHQEYEQNPPWTEAEQEYGRFVPNEFKADPLGFFERQGQNIKPGGVEVDEQGVVREDPTAVKDLPAWEDEKGKKLLVVGKRVNVSKAQVGKSGDPFYEYWVMKKVKEKGLPVADLVARAESGNERLIVMKAIPGTRWSERAKLQLQERGYTKAEIDGLIDQSKRMMAEMEQKFLAAGVIRSWKLKDMVFDVDIDNKKVLKITPTDWERTKITEKFIDDK